MMRALILLHRWLGVAFCLLFAMWFASGIVMHFVPFPALTETGRVAGLTALDLAGVAHGPADAIAASKIKDVTRARLLQRVDGSVYLVSGPSGMVALRADDLSNAAVHSQSLALAIAADFARNRGWDTMRAEVAVLVPFDQWTVAGGFDSDRPLYRVALNDGSGTELYVSSTTGQVILGTTRRERVWNYVGCVAHWIYPTALRSHPAAWSSLVWWLSLLALIGASAGAVVGTLRIGAEGSRLMSPYSGVQAWHHWLGLGCMLFVLTWIFSGWLSMDDGLLFSTGRPAAADAMSVAGMPAWNDLPHDEIARIAAPVKEVEWFAFGGQTYRREGISADRQRLVLVDAASGVAAPDRAFLRPDEVDAASSRLAHGCDKAAVVRSNDEYASSSSVMPAAPIFRVVCGDAWFHIDGASGVLLEKLDASRRIYRWLFGALHTLNFPILANRPALRAATIVVLCGIGFAFSLTGVVIAWRRLLSCLRLPR
jgi:hypothetical protein